MLPLCSTRHNSKPVEPGLVCIHSGSLQMRGIRAALAMQPQSLAKIDEPPLHYLRIVYAAGCLLSWHGTCPLFLVAAWTAGGAPWTSAPFSGSSSYLPP